MRKVVLVHGFASSFDRNWRQPGWVELLEEAGHEVVGVDLLGHGDADRPHEPGAYADLEGYLAAALPPGKLDAVGFSLGARLLLAVASRDPSRFGRIVVGGIGENVMRVDDHEPTAAAIEHGAREGIANTSRAFAHFAASPGNDPLALAACLRRPAAPLTRTDLAAVTVPVLVVVGDQDFAGPAEPLVDALGDARLLVLPGVDHLATASHLGFIDAALRFLDN